MRTSHDVDWSLGLGRTRPGRGTVRDVSFGDKEWTGVFEPLRDPARFAKVTVDGGTIVWPEDGLDMAPEPLYEEARRNSAKPTPSSS